MSLYAERNPRLLEPHFSAHMLAMTAEDLRGKAEIAAELAWRDAEIASLRQQLATACVLADTSAKQAQAFASALDELKGAGAGYWPNDKKDQS